MTAAEQRLPRLAALLRALAAGRLAGGAKGGEVPPYRPGSELGPVALSPGGPIRRDDWDDEVGE